MNLRTLSEFLMAEFMTQGRCPGLNFANAFGVNKPPFPREAARGIEIKNISFRVSIFFGRDDYRMNDEAK